MPSQIYKPLFFMIVCIISLQKGEASLSPEEEREERLTSVRDEATCYLRWVEESWENTLRFYPPLRENLLVESERFNVAETEQPTR